MITDAVPVNLQDREQIVSSSSCNASMRCAVRRSLMEPSLICAGCMPLGVQTGYCRC